ncbi:hypothetical protein CEXT_63271 [Caerostris extrusa]|uniref:TNRC18/BAHCC1-like SH3 domain-containing protein n=1 Tax=Caerostris extrusa TaxID=172846 RepID=A0AAV4RFZ6_CAEEX|nr:hypothetical protein CEXT_63271 [Caerostris extrusa]
MNGRVFAVNRSPVLAWNIEPQLQVPYPDMPAAAAAAISPIVPAASDPYGRCWQNQVDAGTSFPYFGTLYNNSLPPTAYRLQPGCMPNLGQFWPPTPPPDGCGRFDGSNLYFGPPVLRHAENISSNIRSSFPSLGHYSHLVETSKQNQRLFKRETPISPNVSAPSISICSSGSKSDNLNSCCAVDSKMSQISIAHSLPKPELLTVSSGHEPYLCAPDIRSSSSIHPSTDKSCFSPSHSLKNNLNFHNSSQDNIHRTKTMPGNQENCNASPLKNVYFSHYESENINSVHSKNFEKHSERQPQFEHKNNSFTNGNKSKHFFPSPNNYNQGTFSSKKHDYQNGHEFHNGTSSSNAIRGDKDGVMLIKEHYKQKSSSYKVKPEKSTHSDCKYQKNISKTSVLVQGPEYKNSDMFNIPTSVLHPKIEPSDKYFLSSCSSTAPSCMASYTTSGPFLMDKDISSDLRPSISYQNSIYRNSCSLNKPWHYNELPAINLNNCFQSPEAAKPPSQNPLRVNSALHEGLISVAQTAPQDIEVVKVAGTLQSNVQHVSFPVRCKTVEADDEVQIIGIQTKNSPVKHESQYSLERKSTFHPPDSFTEPLCLKQTKREPEIDFQKNESFSPELKKRKASPSLNCESIISNEERNLHLIPENLKHNEKIASNFEDSSPKVFHKSVSPCKTISIKQELLNESESQSFSCAEEKKTDTISKNSDTLNNSHEKIGDNLKAHLLNEKERIVVKVEEVIQDQEMYNENHGLNMLLNGIEKVTSFEKTSCTFNNSIPEEASKNNCSQNEPVNTFNSFKEMNNVRGLDLLSVIAGQRLVSEFDIVKIEIEETDLSCNYPEVKESKSSEEDQEKQVCEMSKQSSKASVFEIQNRLVELRKRYKQKQKELSRLKPKKKEHVLYCSAYNPPPSCITVRKKRFANSYLKGHQKTFDVSDQSSVSAGSCTTSENLNSSICSTNSEQEVVKPTDVNESSSSSKSKNDSQDIVVDSKIKRSSRISIKREFSKRNLILNRRITRRNFGKLKSSDNILEISEESKRIRRNSVNKFYNKRRSSESVTNSLSGVSARLNKSSRKSSSLPENRKSTKVYSLRHSSQKLNKKTESSEIVALVSKTISSKRKSDNPKKYIPSKTSKLSETIIAKQLRSRILFDTSGSTSDDDSLKDGVPDDLYVAMMKCHLGDENKCGSKLLKNVDASKTTVEGPLGDPEPARLSTEHLVDRQRLLALEDGLFYAGFIKECQAPKKYGIALDGQRGNRLHIFTREELLTQAIVESKPFTPELPEGTRPCPSADWSEPRVFVLFDDGDSGQIPTKNVRLIPEDIIPIENISRADPMNSLRSCYNRQRTSGRGKSRKLKCSNLKCSNMKYSACLVLESVTVASWARNKESTPKRRTPSPQSNSKVDSTEAKEAKIKRHKKYKDKHQAPPPPSSHHHH